jgi:hypothetical protein
MLLSLLKYRYIDNLYLPFFSLVLQIALHHIATVEKLPITSTGCPLILRCKNFRIAQFVLDSDLVCHEVYISLLKLSQPGSYDFYVKLFSQNGLMQRSCAVELQFESRLCHLIDLWFGGKLHNF